MLYVEDGKVWGLHGGLEGVCSVGVGLGLIGSKGLLTDTGVRSTPKGSLALYTTGGYKAIGLICGKCSGLATNLWPWIICGRCGESLLEAVSPAQPPRTLRVDWDKNVANPAEESLQSLPAITRLVRESAPLIPVAAPGPNAPVISCGHGRAHLSSMLMEPPGEKTREMKLNCQQLLA